MRMREGGSVPTLLAPPRHALTYTERERDMLDQKTQEMDTEQGWQATPGDVPDQVSQGAKADLGNRAVAAVIDAVIGIGLGWLPAVGGLLAGAYWLLRDGLEFEFMKYRSVGKHLMKLRLVKPDGSPVDIVTSVKRNWMFALGGVAMGLIAQIQNDDLFYPR